jgi:shikimate kinase
MKFFICGFTGAGKSYMLNQLKASDLSDSFDFRDLDELIGLDLAGCGSIPDFINNNGFEAFRSLEYEKLAKLSRLNHQVIALGGGAFNSLTQNILQEFEGIWLDTPFDTCWERISGDESRPIALLDRKESLSLYNQRVKFFEGVYRASSYGEIYSYIKKQLGKFT